MDHNNQENSVMQSAGSFYDRQKSDISALNKLYRQ
ncbi:hypothetical protein N1495_04430 [Streptococcus didelphis]|uniref:Uncharacterized protein n=1 Tax=Streptococcus didelphis TaxID=102886 RepID=A0ABY9LKZ3_9STRE|nr:hypothetical protein [Streptococcus didelphis]WMB28845.1 hypothetical protein N1496_09895 [Streptococcus didelphis]WMB28847.1 hypothetical protein N1496_00020 [Streptococcus didelphis]WMB30174.1 hypothetical protein N1495_04430 [Streptococcus didelphis]